MDDELDNNLVLLTGATSGIGKAIARALLCLFALVALVGCGSSQQPLGDQHAAIEQAVRQYAQDHTAAGLTYEVVVEQIEHNYAVGKLMPDDPTVDVATFYAMYEDGTWRCLTLGTYFFAEQYDEWGIPENLRK